MIIINYAVGRRSFCQWRSTETTKLCCCFPADDDQFSKLKAVFLATGRGCRQDLPLVEVDNRLLVQLLLPKDEGSKTLDETAFFQQLSNQIWSRQCCFLVCGIYGQQTEGAVWRRATSRTSTSSRPWRLPAAMSTSGRGIWPRRCRLNQMMNQNLMNLSLKPASDFNRRVTLWQSTM